MPDTVTTVPADEQLGYTFTYARLPYANTDALGQAKYTIVEEYSRGCIGAAKKTTTFVDETGATTVHPSSASCCSWEIGIPRRTRRSMTFYDDLVVVKNEAKIACYPWQYDKYAIPKYQLVSMEVIKDDPASRGLAAIVPFILGIILLSLGFSSQGWGALGAIGLFMWLGSLFWCCIPFCFRNYYISLQVNEGNDAPVSQWQSRFFGRRMAGMMRSLGRSVRTTVGSKGLTTKTFAVNARPETDFIRNYVYGPLGKATESLHALSLLKHAGIMKELRIDDSATDAVPLMSMAHQGARTASGGADVSELGARDPDSGGDARALGGVLCELRDTHKPMCGCCGPSDESVFTFHRDGIQIETATRFVPFPEGFMRLVVPKHRILGCKIQKVVGTFLYTAMSLTVSGLALVIIGPVNKNWYIMICGIVLLILAACCFYAPFLKAFQGYHVYLDVTEKYRRWVSICLPDEPDADFVFRYVYGPLSKWCGAYHCHAHLGKDDLVMTIQPKTVMTSIHPPLPAPGGAGQQRPKAPPAPGAGNTPDSAAALRGAAPTTPAFPAEPVGSVTQRGGCGEGGEAAPARSRASRGAAASGGGGDLDGDACRPQEFVGGAGGCEGERAAALPVGAPVRAQYTDGVWYDAMVFSTETWSRDNLVTVKWYDGTYSHLPPNQISADPGYVQGAAPVHTGGAHGYVQGAAPVHTGGAHGYVQGAAPVHTGGAHGYVQGAASVHTGGAQMP